MAVIALQKTAVDNASNRKRRAVKWILDIVLGREKRGGESKADHADSLMSSEVPVYDNGSGVLYYVYASSKWTVRAVAILAVVIKRLASLPVDATIDLTRQEFKEKMRASVQAHLVWPLTLEEGDDPFTEAVRQNGNPAAMKAARSIPPGWFIPKRAA